MTHLSVVVFGVFACFGGIFSAVAAEATGPNSLPDLAAACRKAKDQFRPLTEKDVQEAKTALTEALDRLDRRLALDNGNGEDWRKYLEMSALREQLCRSDEPDKAALARIRGRYNSGHEGQELIWFVDVERALQNYLAMTNAVGNERVAAEFARRLETLAKDLETYAAKPTTEDALRIGETLRWLDDARQLPALTRAVQGHFARPNLFGSIAPSLLAAGIAEPIDETIAIRDCILRTSIQGTAHTVGQTSIELVPSADLGVIDTLFLGVTTSSNVGHNGSVTIYSNATTSLAARKRLWMHAGGLASYPSDANAVTNVQICDIRSNKGRAMVERMAWKRAGKQKGTAECIASRHAEERLNARIDQQAADSLDRANDAYLNKLHRPLTERKLFPEQLHFRTSERAISVVGMQAGDGKLAAPAAPPPVSDGAEMSLQVHESMINNFAFDALAGRTVYEEKMQAGVTEALGKLPEKMKGDEDGRPWAITFAPRQPISVTFADDGFKITLRGVRFAKGNEIHNDPMNISAEYKIENAAGRFKAIRQGDIQVFPPDFAPGKQVGGRQQVIRKLLEKRFEKVFEPEMIGEGFEFAGKWKSIGKLLPLQVLCRDGWLVIGWQRASTTPNAG
jgi:hypothetical protein